VTAPANTAKIGTTRCTRTWPGHRMRTHDRGQVITLIGAHRCILAPDHPPGCLCHCGATTTKGDDRG